MSYQNPVNETPWYEEDVDYIVPERIREACGARGLSYKEAAELCEIEYRKFGLMANGHKNIPNELIFKFMTVFNLPKGFFYRVRWQRV